MKKHILCLGDSNTHGLCGDPSDCADGGTRYNEEERWPCLLQKTLGDDYLVIEEGLSGRTTVVDDPLMEGMSALPVLSSILMSHEPIDLLIVMLGTNDTKERFNLNALCIGMGMERLIKKARTIECWGTKEPNILLVAPPKIMGDRSHTPMGAGCVEKSERLSAVYKALAEQLGVHFMDAAGCDINKVDDIHLSKKGHAQLAERFIKIVPEIC